MEEFSKHLTDCKSAIDTLEAALEPVFQERDSLGKQAETPLERARLNVTLGHTALSLYSLYLRLQCVDPKKHPVAQESERANRYLKRVADALDAEQAQPRATRVDIGASKRVLAHALSDQPEVTKKLREK